MGGKRKSFSLPELYTSHTNTSLICVSDCGKSLFIKLNFYSHKLKDLFFPLSLLFLYNVTQAVVHYFEVLLIQGDIVNVTR